ncbi:MAG: hypothetical protein HYU42_05785 [Candidatus Rokubacteria bacterium]|nr:hypothetical protein [Candidatus Rokubacteria bacterium]
MPKPSEATQRFDPGPAFRGRVTFNVEALTVRPYPLEQGHVTIAEFHF